MKKLLFIITLLCCITLARAQQLQTTSFADVQGLLHNPSMAGLEHKLVLGTLYRAQWTGVSGSPRTATVFGSTDLPKYKIGLGGYIFHDKTGPTSRTGIQAAFAKHLRVSDRGQFSLGIEAKALQYSIDANKMAEALGNDPVLASGGNKFKFDAGFGISYAEKNFQVGAAVSQLLQSKLGYYEGSMSTTEEAKLYRHYFLHGLYKIHLDNSNTLTPNFLLVYLPNAPAEFQAGFRFEHNEIFWWGMGARIHQGVNFSAGTHINKKFTIGYSFELYKTPNNMFEKGANAHEIMLKYSMSK
jgi:type IX secretion system PorP/SprF family membrane protein